MLPLKSIRVEEGMLQTISRKQGALGVGALGVGALGHHRRGGKSSRRKGEGETEWDLKTQAEAGGAGHCEVSLGGWRTGHTGHVSKGVPHDPGGAGGGKMLARYEVWVLPRQVGVSKGQPDQRRS